MHYLAEKQKLNLKRIFLGSTFIKQILVICKKYRYLFDNVLPRKIRLKSFKYMFLVVILLDIRLQTKYNSELSSIIGIINIHKSLHQYHQYSQKPGTLKYFSIVLQQLFNRKMLIITQSLSVQQNVQQFLYIYTCMAQVHFLYR